MVEMAEALAGFAIIDDKTLVEPQRNNLKDEK